MRCIIFQFICSYVTVLNFINADYEVYYLDDHVVCPKNEKKVIYLGFEEKSAVILRLSKQNKTFQSIKCHTEFVAPYKHYLSVVIEEMNFRKSYNHCVDYIKFVQDVKLIPDVVRDIFHKGSGEICGMFSYKNSISNFPVINQNNIFAYIQNRLIEKLDVYASVLPFSVDEKLNLTIIITCFKDRGECSSTEFKCIPKSCIYKKFVCDNHINCASTHNNLGYDEANCNDTSMKGFFMNFRTIGLFIMIIIVIAGSFVSLWCCSRATIASNVNNEIIRNEHSETFPDVDSVIVTPFEPSISKDFEDSRVQDDNPPSYHTLFPSNSVDEKKLENKWDLFAKEE